ncbi:MAG: HlyD family efflux transporter periplasmic adaptor subunit [Planctomycetales bacterium]|nr:HlyD family efflux transporter periplasmic adaptor subunit [Planctomycetales bacterium]
MTAMRWMILLVVVAVIVGGSAFAFSPRGLPVDMATAERSSIREFIEEEAKTRLPDIFKITMPLQGRILPISLEEGDRVEQGQIVAQMDVRDLDTDVLEQTNSVKQYERNLEQINLAIEQAEQTVRASQAKYDFAERVFSRTKSLAESNTTSQQRLDQDELQLTESQLDLRKEQLNKSMYVIMRGVVDLMRETEAAKQIKVERDRARAEIRSPVSGVVLKKEKSNEQVVAAGDLLLTVGDPSALEVEADILTQDAVKIAPGDPVSIEGPAIGPEPVSGRVDKIYPQGFTKVSSLGVEQQRVTVIIAFADGVLEQLRQDGRSLGVDYRVRIKVYTDEKADAVVIPRAALFRSASGNWQAFVVRQGRAIQTDVEVGLRNDFFVEILAGVADGEEVIVAPDSTLQSGTEVEPMQRVTATDAEQT